MLCLRNAKKQNWRQLQLSKDANLNAQFCYGATDTISQTKCKYSISKHRKLHKQTLIERKAHFECTRSLHSMQRNSLFCLFLRRGNFVFLVRALSSANSTQTRSAFLVLQTSALHWRKAASARNNVKLRKHCVFIGATCLVYTCCGFKVQLSTLANCAQMHSNSLKLTQFTRKSAKSWLFAARFKRCSGHEKHKTTNNNKNCSSKQSCIAQTQQLQTPTCFDSAFLASLRGAKCVLGLVA